MAKQEGPEIVNNGGGPCRYSPRRLACLTNTPNNRQVEMNMGLLQIIYENPFAGMDHEDPYTHLTKFYELVVTLGAPEAQEEAVFMTSSPYSLTGKEKDWYLDQLTQVMTKCNVLEEKFPNRFFPHNRFMDAKTTISVFA